VAAKKLVNLDQGEGFVCHAQFALCVMQRFYDQYSKARHGFAIRLSDGAAVGRRATLIGPFGDLVAQAADLGYAIVEFATAPRQAGNGAEPLATPESSTSTP
jgi:hypothetical protein